MTRDDALTTAGAFLLALALIPAFWPAAASAAPEERDQICQRYKGTALWGQCTRAVDNGCHIHEFAHPRCQRWAETWEDQTGIIPVWEIPCAGSESKCVFLTSGSYTGELGGLAGADQICGRHAAAAGLPGEFKAWLSTFADDGASPDTRFAKSSDPYRLVAPDALSGLDQVATSYADLVQNDPAIPVRVTEFGDTELGLAAVWTATSRAGTAGSGGSFAEADCEGWTSASNGARGFIGSSLATDGWSDLSFANQAGGNRCSAESKLYCFEQ